MRDPTFGSHYLQSYCDLNVQGDKQIDPKSGTPNKAEAVRLWKAAIADADLAIKEVQGFLETEVVPEQIVFLKSCLSFVTDAKRVTECKVKNNT